MPMSMLPGLAGDAELCTIDRSPRARVGERLGRDTEIKWLRSRQLEARADANRANGQSAQPGDGEAQLVQQ